MAQKHRSKAKKPRRGGHTPVVDERNGRSSGAPEGPPPAGPDPGAASLPPRAEPLAAARASYDRAHLVLRQWCDQLQLLLLAARGDDEGTDFSPGAGSKEARELVLDRKSVV